MTTYSIKEIPEFDPAEFDLYRAARRTGEYFYQRIENGILNVKHTAGWIPIGKITHSRILSSNNEVWDIAIMYQQENKPEEMIWFHLLLN